MLKIKGEILKNEKMRKWTTMGVGGPVDTLMFPKDKEDLQKIITYIKEKDIPYLIMGKGSNIIFSERGFRGIVVRMDRLTNISIKTEKIEVEAGYLLNNLIKVSQERGLGGIEKLYGIPGTVGGALAMNAGAYGQEIGDVVERVEVQGEDGFEYSFGYRWSNVGKRFIYAAIIRLRKMDGLIIKKNMEEALKKRKESQPMNFRSSGSIFKNYGDIKAWKLIKKCGLVGTKIGGALVSKKHANFIVNDGSATGDDVISLIELIKKRVYEETGVDLKLEVKIVK
ncbi:UDP-N-acetylmuramate dehydrogenase [candidate division WOR-3 bacterium]|nr:UDP-N-acetylmuramate dehydrogenase [candidate division WOR-3 bacterium]